MSGETGNSKLETGAEPQIARRGADGEGATKLLPCPFCGAMPWVDEMRDPVRVVVLGCCCHVSPSVTGMDLETAAAKWNQRITNSAPHEQHWISEGGLARQRKRLTTKDTKGGKTR